MRSTLLILLCCISGFIQAQTQFSKVRIFASDQELVSIANLGIAVDHGQRKANTWLDTDLSASEIQLLADHGVDYTILIEDVKSFYVARNQNLPVTESDRVDCPTPAQTGFNPTTPANFHLGTYAGFYTYQEFLDELDEMAAAYPNLISARTPIDTFLTHENRPLYWVKISDNPNTDEAEPEVLYTAIHHAREPAGLSQLIFYMWYMLENYGTDSEITYLLDHTELYFVPMINPDGYIENEVNDPNGGGMHRKNKRNVGTSNPGVDLNRNYDYQWNVSGTTSNVNGDTYAGTHGFSEPETQAIKYLCETRDFKFALNAHTYSNLLLFPFGYASAAFTTEHDYFQAFSNHQVQFNGYVAEKSSNLYPAAGDSDDWMYDGDLATKPKIYALTPEIGGDNDGFWPAQNRIIPLSKENVWMNMIQAHLPHRYAVTTDQSPNRIEDLTGSFYYDIERLGLENGPIAVEIIPVTGIQSVGNSNTHTLNLMDIADDSISYTLNPGLYFGDEIKYVLATDFGLWTRHDTITKTYGAGTAVFVDNANGMTNWSGNWGLTNEYFVSPNFSITDSPNTSYANNTDNSLQLIESISLANATYAFAQFHARWEIELDYDYVQFMVSTDNGDNWTPLCGHYTNTGNANQDMDQPLYDGMQTEWVQEEIDLTDYIGMTDLKFKFRLISDAFVTEDGFAFDDFKIVTDASDLSTPDFTAHQIAVYPNPAHGAIQVKADKLIHRIALYSQTGQLIQILNDQQKSIYKIDISTLQPGVYFLNFYDTAGNRVVKKVSIY